MKEIRLNKITAAKNVVRFDYEKPEELKKYFSQETDFFYEYPSDFDLSDVPRSILAIPFVMNFMPIAWMTDADICVDELDSSFYGCIPDVLNGLKRVYPEVKFGGKLIVNKVEENTYKTDGRPAILFSGGVDAMSVLASHYKEQPTLVNVWGADVALDDDDNHDVIDRDLRAIAKNMGVDYFYVKSSLRFCFVESELHKDFAPVLKDYWWHGIQHSIGLLSLLAPYDYLCRDPVNYIAASFTEKQIGKVRCVNFPFIDDCVKIASTKCIEDGFDLRRIDKVMQIIAFAKEKDTALNLKVCFNPVSGQNCCMCEKCLRTIAVIIAGGGMPSQYGFQIEKKAAIRRMKKYLKKNIISEGPLSDWVALKGYALENDRCDEEMLWMRSFKFNTYKPSIFSRGLHFAQRTAKKILGTGK